MKKVLFGLIATVMLSFVGNAQTSAKKHTFCITLSCCGIGILSVDVWSQTTCYSYSSSKATLRFAGSTKDSEVTIVDDVLLAGIYSEKGDDLILPKGKYMLVNNEISFTPVASKAKVHCVSSHYSGTFFGESYSGGVKYCWTWIWDSRSSNGNLTITPELSQSQKEQLAKGSAEITFNKDFIAKDSEVNYTVKAGKYTVNQDGNIYLQNIKLK
jgi:hypothetical protein